MAETIKAYFSYGSNLSHEQMSLRCPGAEPQFPAVLKDYSLHFGRYSEKWGGGGATILPEKNSEVYGGVYKINSEHEKSLDFFEGFPNIYRKVDIALQTPHGPLLAMTYVQNSDETSAPSDDYVRVILSGLNDFGLSPGHMNPGLIASDYTCERLFLTKEQWRGVSDRFPHLRAQETSGVFFSCLSEIEKAPGITGTPETLEGFLCELSSETPEVLSIKYQLSAASSADSDDRRKTGSRLILCGHGESRLPARFNPSFSIVGYGL